MARLRNPMAYLLLPAAGLAAGCTATAPTLASHQAVQHVMRSAPPRAPSTGLAAVPRAPASHRSRPLAGPISATFISPSAGWLLGLRACHRPGCSWLRMRKTTDGGRHWSAVPAPPARHEFQPGHGTRSSVSQIRFADTADGWAFGPGLWATHDGGVSWHRVSTHGQYVQSLETAGGWVLAVLSRCAPQGSPCNGVAVYSSPVAADSWRQVPGAGGAYRSASVVVSGNTGYVTDVPGLGRTAAVAVQAGPADGSAGWSSLRSPCRRAWGVWGAWLAATPGGTLVMACANQPSAGWQAKRAYLSANGGQSWQRLDDPSWAGYLGGISITPAGTIFLSGPRYDVWASRDHGHSWHDVLADRSGAANGFAAAMTTDTQGFALPQSAAVRGIIWFTYDDGHTWRPVTVR